MPKAKEMVCGRTAWWVLRRGGGHHSQLPIILRLTPQTNSGSGEPGCSLSLAPCLRVAVGAVDRSAASGLKGNLGVFGARGANSRKHLPLLSVAFAVAASATIATVVAATTLLFSGCPAVRATPGIVGEALGGEELLLGSTEGETCAAI